MGKKLSEFIQNLFSNIMSVSYGRDIIVQAPDERWHMLLTDFLCDLPDDVLQYGWPRADVCSHQRHRWAHPGNDGHLGLDPCSIPGQESFHIESIYFLFSPLSISLCFISLYLYLIEMYIEGLLYWVDMELRASSQGLVSYRVYVRSRSSSTWKTSPMSTSLRHIWLMDVAKITL